MVAESICPRSDLHVPFDLSPCVLHGTCCGGTTGYDSVAEAELMLWSFIFAFTLVRHRLYYFSVAFSRMSFAYILKLE